jgi:hypothetical protein
MTDVNEVIDYNRIEALMARGRAERSRALYGMLRVAANGIAGIFGGRRPKGLGTA